MTTAARTAHGPAAAAPAGRRRAARASFRSLAEPFITPVRHSNARQSLRCLTPEIRSEDRILDLGCGRGILGALLEVELGCSVTGCDVIPINHSLDAFHIFDGRHVPFPPGAFDITLLSYVLHHAPDPLTLLREARRVSRRGVIVIEDTPRCWADRAWGRIHVHSYNSAYELPHGRVRSDAEWRPIFAAAGLHVARHHVMGRLERFPPNARTQYTLVPAAP